MSLCFKNLTKETFETLLAIQRRTIETLGPHVERAKQLATHHGNKEMTTTIQDLKRRARHLGITSVTLALLAIAGNTVADAQAAPAPSAPSAPSAPAATGAPAESGDYRPRKYFTSPDGHIVMAYEATRAPAFCTTLFKRRKGKSYRAQYRFWTKCILGGRLPNN